MKTLEEIINTVPEGMSWLIRSCAEGEEGKFLANICDEDRENYFPIFAGTAIKALELAIEAATGKGE